MIYSLKMQYKNNNFYIKVFNKFKKNIKQYYCNFLQYKY